MSRIPVQPNKMMPPFVRIGWVSETARQIWVPRLDRITSAWRQIGWHSVVTGVRDAAIFAVAATELDDWTSKWEAAGLAAIPLQLSVGDDRSELRISKHSKPELLFTTAVVRAGMQRLFQSNWQENAIEATLRWTGYPNCCAAAYRRRHHRLIDHTWPMTLATKPMNRTAKRTVALESSPESNILWRAVDVRAVPHLPCNFGCTASIAVGRAMIAVGREAGYDAEMDLLEQVLAWPAEWTSLHGIAELHTPICRIATRTDYSAARHAIQYHGAAWPAEGARGANFPYQNRSPQRWTGSTVFRRATDDKA